MIYRDTPTLNCEQSHVGVTSRSHGPGWEDQRPAGSTIVRFWIDTEDAE